MVLSSISGADSTSVTAFETRFRGHVPYLLEGEPFDVVVSFGETGGPTAIRWTWNGKPLWLDEPHGAMPLHVDYILRNVAGMSVRH